jgi:beta-glucanase (GH16 family)
MPPVPAAAPDGPDYLPQGKGWQLVWSDEFEGTELDRTKWAPEESCWGGGNNERQCYTDRDTNVQLVNGLLRLIAVEEEFTGPLYPEERNSTEQGSKPYTSGKVRTRGLADWKYGRFAARVKLPAGQGTWPAFWMLSAEDFYGGWPLSGEIDIMEAVNLGASCGDCQGGTSENRLHGTIHYGNAWPANSRTGSSYTLPGAAQPDESYHVYAVEWGEGRMNWFVDDVHFFSVNQNDWFTVSAEAAGNDLAPFDRNFYLMFNLAVGGNWPENVNENTFDPSSFPNQLLVDWVRVYTCETAPETGLDCMAPPL